MGKAVAVELDETVRKRLPLSERGYGSCPLGTATTAASTRAMRPAVTGRETPRDPP